MTLGMALGIDIAMDIGIITALISSPRANKKGGAECVTFNNQID